MNAKTYQKSRENATLLFSMRRADRLLCLSSQIGPSCIMNLTQSMRIMMRKMGNDRGFSSREVKQDNMPAISGRYGICHDDFNSRGAGIPTLRKSSKSFAYFGLTLVIKSVVRCLFFPQSSNLCG